jgi:hypothetical protein
MFRASRAAAAWAAAAGLLAIGAVPAIPPQDPEAGKELLRARELLRAGNLADREEAIRRLIALDSVASITCVEEAILRSASELDRLAKDVEKLDDELWEAEFKADFFLRKYPQLYNDAAAELRAVRARWDALMGVVRGHLQICLDGAATFASFRSPEATERVARGALNCPAPLARQAYIRSLGSPGMAARLPALLELLRSGEARVRALAVRSLRDVPPRRETLDAVAPLLADRCWSVRIGAAEVVARMPFDVAVPLLAAAAAKETGEPALQVDSLLRSLTGVSLAGKPAAWAAWIRDNGAAVADGTFRPREEAPAEEASRTEAAFFQIPIESENLLVVMDLSGSMTVEMKEVDRRTAALLGKHGLPQDRLSVALVQAIQMIEDLPAGARYNLLAFHEKVARFAAKGVAATPSGKKSGISWLLAQKTGLRTNIWDALRQAFGDHMAAGGASRFEDLPDTIVFLTDGVPTMGRFRDERSLADLVGLWNAGAGVVVHAVGIGDGFAEKLLQDLTESTGGYYMDTRVNRLFGTRRRPVVPPEARSPRTAEAFALAKEVFEGTGYDDRAAALPALAAACAWAGEGTDYVAGLLGDPEAPVRAAAAAALATLGAPGAAALAGVLETGPAPAVEAALAALPGLGATAGPAVPAAAKVAALEGGALRTEAIRALGALGPAASAAIPALEGIAAKAGGDLAKEATAALGRIRAKPVRK